MRRIRIFGTRVSARKKALLYVWTLYRSVLRPGTFDQVESYCMFIGYPRSGHSLIGSLLNAHPDIAIAHELDALDFLQFGFGRTQLYHLILENTRQFAASGSAWTGYSYAVLDSWQGRYRRLRVIGDKKGGLSSLRLYEHPELLARLQKTVKQPVKLIHVVRNPFDNIATMARRRQAGSALASNIQLYSKMCQSNAAIRIRAPADSLYEVKLEGLVADPRSHLEELCAFLDVECAPEYFDACARIVASEPRRTRDRVGWSAGDRTRVDDLIRRYDFLDGYGFD